MWDNILSDENSILAGDFKAHSTMWNSRCTNRRNATSRKDLIRAFDFQGLNDDQPTRPSDGLHSIIDLTLTTPGAGPNCREWGIMDREEASLSDHEMMHRGGQGRPSRSAQPGR